MLGPTTQFYMYLALSMNYYCKNYKCYRLKEAKVHWPAKGKGKVGGKWFILTDGR